MISLARLDEPEVLKANKNEWLTRYLEQRSADPKKRPSSSQYAHREIRGTLGAMSFWKCFYCEQKLSETECEVDHYLEVSEKPELAFEWINLYLCCRGCNKKLANTSISVSDCLNPCDPLENPNDHLTFESEIITSKSGSSRGLKTIQKYKLDRDDLNHKRARQLIRFLEVVSEIKDKLIREGRKRLNEAEKERLFRFTQPDWPFSLMFRVYLDRLDL